MLLNQFYPDEWVESVYAMPWETLAGQGIKGVIFDIDNTLVPHDAPADERVLALMDRLSSLGFRIFLLSNNKEPRVSVFAEAVGLPYLSKAGKPGRSGYLRAMQEMGTTRSTTVFAGDQLFTDVYGAKRTGIYSILVKPLNPREEIQIVLKRYLEKIVLHFYKKKCERS